MSDLTIFPADIAAMSPTAQLAALPITDFVAAERQCRRGHSTWLKKAACQVRCRPG